VIGASPASSAAVAAAAAAAAAAGGGGGGGGGSQAGSQYLIVDEATAQASAGSTAGSMKPGTSRVHCKTVTKIFYSLLHPFSGLVSRTAWVSRYQKGKTSLDLDEARDYGVLGCSGISWIICKQSAPCSRQITTPTPRHSIFTGQMLFLAPNQQCQSTEVMAKIF